MCQAKIAKKAGVQFLQKCFASKGTPNRQVKMNRYLLIRRMANLSSRPWSIESQQTE